MKKLIIKIGNETHELPYNGEVFSFEISEKYVPKVGDCVKVDWKECEYVFYFKIKDIHNYIECKETISFRENNYTLNKNKHLFNKYRNFTQITPEELKAKYAEAGYDWDYETNEVKPLKWMPKEGDFVWYLLDDLTIVNGFYNDDLYYLLEKGLLFPTEAECQKFSDHCLKYFDKK